VTTATLPSSGWSVGIGGICAGPLTGRIGWMSAGCDLGDFRTCSRFTQLCSSQHLQSVLGAPLHRKRNAFYALGGRVGLQDHQLLVVVEFEDVRRQADAHAVGLAQVPVNPDLHRPASWLVLALSRPSVLRVRLLSAPRPAGR